MGPSTQNCWSSQEADSCEEQWAGEGLKAHVHQQVAPCTLGTQFCLVAHGMPLVPCRKSETVILLPGICSPGVRENGPEPEDLEAKDASAKEGDWRAA